MKFNAKTIFGIAVISALTTVAIQNASRLRGAAGAK
jgi:hypothetical protein